MFQTLTNIYCNNYVLYSVASEHIKLKDILSVESAKNMDI